tara:strand:- start:197 stop:391 length:195 start_codon:yes stop_codon:yes gene_type:complete
MDNVEKTKLDIIKKVLMLNTDKELQVVRNEVSSAICREVDEDHKLDDEFQEWKKQKQNGGINAE